MTVRPGIRVGPYEIVAQIGAGGMGEVYRARDTRLGRDVAIKVLPVEFAADPDRLRRFEQEARAVAALDHPNILAIHDIGTHDGAPYIVTELLEGESLRERLSSGALPVRRAVEVVVQIAQGLAAAHEKGIVHRDVKPGNVFVTRDGHVKILDFGLAKLTPPRTAEERAKATTVLEATDAGIVLGTVAYMSPEQVLGKPLDARSDLFSLGVVLYEMLSGTRPFQKENAPETMAAILKEEPPDLAESGKPIPPGLDRIVRHCLEKEPASRFQTARDIAFALESMSQSTSAATASLRVANRTRRLAFGIVSALMGGTALLAVGLYLGRASAKPPVTSFQRLTFRRGWVNAARFAPDGRTVVYSAAWEGGPNEVFSLRLDSPESRSLGYSPAELLAISPTSELALSLDSHLQRGGLLLAGTLALVPFSGGTPRPLDERITFADWSPDGKELALVRATDTTDQLEYPAGHVLYTTGTFISSPRVSPSGDLVAFIEHGVDSFMGSVAVVDRAGKKVTLTETFVGGARGLAWSPKGDEIWFTAARSGLRQELRAVTLGGRERLMFGESGPVRLLDVAKDGRILVTREQLAGRCFFRGEKDSVDRELSWLDFTSMGALSRDGRLAVLCEAGEGAVGVFQTYLRETNGASPMKLGRGWNPDFSPDERFIIAVVDDPSGIVIHPVGAGQPRTIPMPGLSLFSATLSPDGRTIVTTAGEASHGWRIWLTDLAGSKPRPITSEGISGTLITPDGRFVVGVSGGSFLAPGRTLLYPLAGGEPQPLRGLLRGERVAGWCADGQSYSAYRSTEFPAKIYRVNGKTGERQLIHEIMPLDRAGKTPGLSVVMTPDGKSYGYNLERWLSELHLVEGLK